MYIYMSIWTVLAFVISVGVAKILLLWWAPDSRGFITPMSQTFMTSVKYTLQYDKNRHLQSKYANAFVIACLSKLEYMYI